MLPPWPKKSQKELEAEYLRRVARYAGRPALNKKQSRRLRQAYNRWQAVVNLNSLMLRMATIHADRRTALVREILTTRSPWTGLMEGVSDAP